MQKKYLLFVMVFSCAAQAVIVNQVNNPQEDRLEQLRSDLQELRDNQDNIIYIKALVDGVEAIEQAKQEKIKLIEADRLARKYKVCGNRPWWGSEPKDTIVYNADKDIDEELNKYKAMHEHYAEGYKGFSNVLHRDVNLIIKCNLNVQNEYFERMYTALNKCNNDGDCYVKYYPTLSYKKISDSAFRNKRKGKALKNGLAIAHNKHIPVSLSELRTIVEKDPQIIVLYKNIEKFDSLIDDSVNPERIKEREAKKIKDLEDQKKKEEEEKKQALKDQLKTDNK